VTAESTSTTLTRGRYFPASVVLPDGQRFRRVFVVLAEGGEHAGLWVYDRPDQVAFHANVNWLRTNPPKTGRRARTGIDVELTDGTTAVITPGVECRCGQLGRWAGPDWARTVSAR
jgi:hypothetical protein